MITFLSSPKGFNGIARENQIAAIQSWQRVHPDAEVILYGEAPGTAGISRSLGVTHVGSIASSPTGIPLFDAIVDYATVHARFDVQVYLNGDILLTDHILKAVQTASFPRYLMIGQRIDLSEHATGLIHAGTGDATLEIAARDERTTLHPPTGIDYFVFTRGLWTGLQSLVIGRAGYDSALVAFCLRRGIPVIDATYMIPALHQFHDYGHVAGAEKEVFLGADARNNRRIHDVEHSPPTITDATWRIIGGRMVRNRSRGDVLRQFESFLRYRKNLRTVSYGVRAVWRALTALGLYRPAQIQLSEIMRPPRTSESPGGELHRESLRGIAR